MDDRKIEPIPLSQRAKESKEFIRAGLIYEDLQLEFDDGDINTPILFQIQISRLLNEASNFVEAIYSMQLGKEK